MLRSTNRSPSPSSLSFDNAAVAADDSPLFRSNSSIKLFLQKIDTRQRLHRLDNTRSAIARFDLAMEFFRRITDGETAANRRTQTINATTTNKTITTTTTTIIIKTTMRKIVEEVKREQRSISVVELPPALAIEKQDQEVEEEEVNGENEVDETVSLIAEQTRSSPPPPPRPWWLSMRNRVKRLYPKSSDDHDAAAGELTSSPYIPIPPTRFTRHMCSFCSQNRQPPRQTRSPPPPP